MVRSGTWTAAGAEAAGAATPRASHSDRSRWYFSRLSGSRTGPGSGRDRPGGRPRDPSGGHHDTAVGPESGIGTTFESFRAALPTAGRYTQTVFSFRVMNRVADGFRTRDPQIHNLLAALPRNRRSYWRNASYSGVPLFQGDPSRFKKHRILALPGCQNITRHYPTARPPRRLAAVLIWGPSRAVESTIGGPGLLAPEVIADGALGDPEGACDLDVGLSLLMQDLERHEFLRTELVRHGRAFCGNREPIPAAEPGSGRMARIRTSDHHVKLRVP